LFVVTFKEDEYEAVAPKAWRRWCISGTRRKNPWRIACGAR
jgi:hypothetical protein